MSVASQTFSSLTSLLLSVSVARTASVEQFGEFGLIFGTNLLAANLIRSLLVEPLVVDQGRRHDGRQVERLLGSALLSSSAAGAALCAVLVGIGPILGVTSVVVACAALAFAVTQDCCKSYAIGRQTPTAAAASDASWFAFQVVVTVLGFAGVLDIAGVLAGWGLGALVGIVVGALCMQARQARAAAGIREAWGYRRVGLSWMMETATGNLVGQSMPWLLAAVHGLASVAAYRGALVLLGPTSVVLVGLRLSMLPVLARAAPSALLRRTRALSVGFATVSVVIGLPVLLVSDSLGEALLGDSWSEGRAVFGVALAWRVANSATTPATLAMRAANATRALLSARAKVSILTAVGGIIGALMGEAAGAFVGLALGTVAGLPLWHLSLRHAIHAPLSSVRSS